MPLFNLPPRNDRSSDTAIIKKAKSSKKAPATVRGGGGIATQIANIKAKVLKELGQFSDETLIIRDELTLSTYISKAIAYGEIAIDTETNGLDPLTDECVGVCLYVPNEKTTYIPLNHVSYITMERVDNQLPADVVAKYLKLLEDNAVRIIMFNAVFDIRVSKNQVGVKLSCYWDCYLGARVLNENEPVNKLKPLHQKYVLGGVGDAFAFDELFKGIKASLIPINIFALYAAHDPKITWEYYDFQRKYLYYDENEPFTARDGMNGVAWAFFNIELPINAVVADMEDTGVALDIDYANKLSAKYNQLAIEKQNTFYDLLSEYQDKIDSYVHSHPDCKLDDPINIASPTQLSVLLYDIIGLDAGINKKTQQVERGTGEGVLATLDHPICKAILDYREVGKLLSTYIDKLPKCLNPKDGRVHGKFNSYGADTGRFSSSDPNLQNIPSHNKDIRPMFVATKGYVLMSADYSQQEPKCLAALCKKGGDSQMYDTFMQGKDLYSEIASKAFHKPYDECREFDDNGNKNPPEYKERRTQAKSILLGALYGRGVESIGEQLHCSTEQAQAIKNSVFEGFPAIGDFEEKSLKMAKELGYVTTICGRKRRLPDLQLPEYEFKWEKGYEPTGDILDFDELEIEVPYSKQKFYITKLNNARGKKGRYAVIDQAKKEHIRIIDNRGKIGDATRQCVNARIQGSSADLTKKAMIELYANKRLKELGFRLLIQVHDEVIAECPEENMEECSKLLAETMSHAAEEILEMPIKVDVEITRAWYGETVSGAEVKEKEVNTSHGLDVENWRQDVANQ